MSFDDLSISNISKRPSLTEFPAEWKFSDCLRLHRRDVLNHKISYFQNDTTNFSTQNSIFEDSEANNTRKSSLENQSDEINDFNNSEKENELFEYTVQDKRPKRNLSKQNSSNRIALSPVDILK